MTSTFTGAPTRRPEEARHDRIPCAPRRARWRRSGDLRREELVPGLRHGDIVIMDDPSSHKGARTRALLEAVGASILFLPPCGPDPDPVENAFAGLETMLRKAAARTFEALSAAIERIADATRRPNAPAASD
ncbi:transposase [Geminicoccaceae bacterium 1502E]|nr:transposase [Geminicoccaceae bacterium 1502E]